MAKFRQIKRPARTTAEARDEARAGTQRKKEFQDDPAQVVPKPVMMGRPFQARVITNDDKASRLIAQTGVFSFSRTRTPRGNPRKAPNRTTPCFR